MSGETRNLPEWQLEHLYDGPDSSALAADLAAAETRARALAKRCRGQLADLDGTALAEVIAEYEWLSETLGRVMSYASLHHADDMSDTQAGQFLQSMQERTNTIAVDMLFVTLELNRIDDEVLDSRLQSPALARYAPWLRDIRMFRPHQLSDEIERLLHEKQVAGGSAWVRLFDETMARLRVPFRGDQLTCTQALDLLSSKDPAARRDIARALADVLSDNIHTFSLVINTLAKDKAIEDRWRSLPQPISRRNLENRVENEVVEALLTAVREAYPSLSHRYYAIKARWFGVSALDYWDRNAPPPDDDDRRVPWNEARAIVLDAWERFSPALAGIGQRFFEEGWIDAPPRPGKAPGAFSHPTVPSAHPYILLNYHGRTRDVMTLAHELGHGVHQVLAAQQGVLMAETPLTLAETASTFGEQLTFRSLLDTETDPVRRRVLIAAKAEDMLNTVIRQAAFCEFERRFHRRRAENELTPDEIGDLWMSVQSESLGPAVRLDDSYRVYWSYIPHFVHTPFYVYAYAFGDCLANALYAVYRESRSEWFEERYRDILGAGGALRHRELLAPFGLDARDPAFWHKGLAVISGLIDELDGESHALRH